eukprot:TRINITY_DN12745_c0_g1_i1.p1 TRINITY_DN12745_c0_g1~~TRINITY_DN12745_c0_g1_i1.p1  ORF type:complete len:346 (-),score=65.32 TRINITY_DN12745_c0_g1_i1:30-1067(-)
MAYNGVGLSTPRGSGTSGFVQKNLANVRPVQRAQLIQDLKPLPPPREANKDILEHERRRQVEVKVLELAEQMESEGASGEDIDRSCNELREKLLQNLAAPSNNLQESHQMAEAKVHQNENFRAAVGVAKDYAEGDAFNQDLQERRRQERIANFERKEEERALAEAKRQIELEQRIQAGGGPADVVDSAEPQQRRRTYKYRGPSDHNQRNRSPPRRRGAYSPRRERSPPRRYGRSRSPPRRYRSRSPRRYSSRSPRRYRSRSPLGSRSPPPRRRGGGRSRSRSGSRSSYSSSRSRSRSRSRSPGRGRPTEHRGGAAAVPPPPAPAAAADEHKTAEEAVSEAPPAAL